jgi:hypothetical protein
VLKGLMVIQESGTPVYTFFTDKRSEDRELLLSGFLAAIESFASETSLSPDGGTIHSIKLSQTLLSFRLLSLQNKKGEAVKYFYVLLTDINNKQQDNTEAFLEYVILNFLSYDNGEFRRKLREPGFHGGGFEAFDEFMRRIGDSDWNSVKKRIKPVPGSLLQGVLNEVRDFVTLDQILQLNPKIVRLGSYYAWLSDDLPKDEEEELLGRIKELLSHLFGESLYDSIMEDVEKRMRKTLGG